MSELTPLAPRARLLFHVQAAVRWLVFWTPVCGALWIASWFVVPFSWGTGLVVALWFAMLIRALWMPSLAFDRWGYSLLDDQLLVQHGVLLRRVAAIPTHRVQHVDTHQGPFEQALGLARLQVYTASGQGADGVIPGLDVKEAERLRTELVRRRGDDGV